MKITKTWMGYFQAGYNKQTARIILNILEESAPSRTLLKPNRRSNSSRVNKYNLTNVVINKTLKGCSE